MRVPLCLFSLSLLPSGPGDSRAEFGSSRERLKKLTRVPTGGAATRSFSRNYNGDEGVEPARRRRAQGGDDQIMGPVPWWQLSPPWQLSPLSRPGKDPRRSLSGDK